MRVHDLRSWAVGDDDTDLLLRAITPLLVGSVACLLALNAVDAIGRAYLPGAESLVMGRPGNPLAWLSALLFTALSGLCLLAAAASRRERGWWLGVAAVTALCSLDEAVDLHSRVGARADSVLPSGQLSYGWLLPVLAVAVAAVAGAGFLFRLPRPTRLGLLLAGAVFLSGSVAVDLAGGLWKLQEGTDDGVHVVLAVLEEDLEVTGVLVAIAVLARHVHARGIRLSVGPAGAATPAGARRPAPAQATSSSATLS